MTLTDRGAVFFRDIGLPVPSVLGQHMSSDQMAKCRGFLLVESLEGEYVHPAYDRLTDGAMIIRCCCCGARF